MATKHDADPPSIGRPRELAERMAAKARMLRDSIERILAQETEAGPLHDLLAGYREVLIADLSAAAFADLQAQTAAYGLFAARCQHEPNNGPFTRRSAGFVETTPFLRGVFGRIAGPDIDERIAWIVDELARLLDRADMAAILSEFGRKTRQEDPVVHFYEDFLAAYDPRLRKMRGVYYTPEPVVSYIVRSVDRLLHTRLGLADGLAARTPLILDPAAGTGTFLREVIASIREKIEAKGLSGAWSGYVQEHLLPRLFGFELLMAPYAICHLKLALEIGGTDRGFAMPAGERLNVFLTNALEEAHESTAGALFAHEIAHEAAGADAVKREKPVMVVLGNPPYSGHSANKGHWIKGLLRGWDRTQKTDSYFEVGGQPLDERNSKWLNDDYVKFIRFAQWRIERTGEGVLGFITNHSYLDNPTFRGMRESLMAAFDELYLLDLHGNAKKKERTPEGGKDENVFDIQQGVVIGLFVKRKGDKGPTKVFHADVWGRAHEQIRLSRRSHGRDHRVDQTNAQVAALSVRTTRRGTGRRIRGWLEHYRPLSAPFGRHRYLPRQGGDPNLSKRLKKPPTSPSSPTAPAISKLPSARRIFSTISTPSSTAQHTAAATPTFSSQIFPAFP